MFLDATTPIEFVYHLVMAKVVYERAKFHPRADVASIMRAFLERWARLGAVSHPSPFHYDEDVDEEEEEEWMEDDEEEGEETTEEESLEEEELLIEEDLQDVEQEEEQEDSSEKENAPGERQEEEAEEVSPASRKRKRPERVVIKLADSPDTTVLSSDTESDVDDRKKRILELDSDKKQSRWGEWNPAIQVYNPYVEWVKFGRRCEVCGVTSHSKISKRGKLMCPAMARGNFRCGFAGCKAPEEHKTVVCPYLHRRCPRCLHLGHCKEDKCSSRRAKTGAEHSKTLKLRRMQGTSRSTGRTT